MDGVIFDLSLNEPKLSKTIGVFGTEWLSRSG